ncbi:hypothetical protein KR018_012328 [Drosophila ironensis]|nr:hypothetical protein KR018_012328 [Drosophila ironensis]
MLKWTASAQRLNEFPAERDAEAQSRHKLQRRQRRQRRATIANKENVPDYTASTPVPVSLGRLRNSPLVLAPLSDIRNVTPEPIARHQSPVQRVQSVRYATTLPQFAEDYSPNGVLLLPTGQHLALRGLAPLDPFLEQPRYISGAGSGAATLLKKRKLDADLVATMEVPPREAEEKTAKTPNKRPVTPQPPASASAQMGDQTLDRLIDAILDSACKADASSKKKPRRSTFNLRRRTLVKQQMDADCNRNVMVLSPSYTPADDPASDLSFAGLVPLGNGLINQTTPEPATPIGKLTHQMLVQMPTPKVVLPAVPACDTTFCLETPVRKLKRGRVEGQVKETAAKESPLKRFKVDERNYFEVGLALPSSIYV